MANRINMKIIIILSALVREYFVFSVIWKDMHQSVVTCLKPNSYKVYNLQAISTLWFVFVLCYYALVYSLVTSCILCVYNAI